MDFEESLLKSPRLHIPEGCYCYSYVEEKYKVCPFWTKVQDKPEQENGYCHYLKQGDWETDGLLWDKVKECGVNEELPEWFTGK